ncbi:rhomboid-like protein 2 [Quercus suber]|uniref:Rhomboid-like protein 2 n=1 Tax=Quercus suber TaxID=58331 RepID=A0AAW0KK63_QUESU
MDVRTYSLALVLNVLFVLPGNCEQITFETLQAPDALFGIFGAMVSELLTNWTIYANKSICLFFKLCKYNKTTLEWMRTVTKDLGSLHLPSSAFEASQLADCAATSFILITWVPEQEIWSQRNHKVND